MSRKERSGGEQSLPEVEWEKAMYQIEEDQDDYYIPDEEPIETLHLYVYQEELTTPRREMSLEIKNTIRGIATILLLLAGMIALCLIPNTPSYTVQIVRVPAHFFPLQTFSVTSPILPTGTRTESATSAHGMLTIYNGSILSHQLPGGFIIAGNDGVEVVTDKTVIVPSGSAPDYGIAIVSAHAVAAGSAGNIPAFTINSVYGTDLTVKNLTAFHGGQDTQTKTIATPADSYKALTHARYTLSAQENQHRGLLAFPCREKTQQRALMLTVAWMCQFVTYPTPPEATVLSAQLRGREVLLQIKIIVRFHTSVVK